MVGVTAERIGCVRFMGIFNSFVNFGTVPWRVAAPF